MSRTQKGRPQFSRFYRLVLGRSKGWLVKRLFCVCKKRPRPQARLSGLRQHRACRRPLSQKLRLGVKPLESIGTCLLSWHVKAGRLRGSWRIQTDGVCREGVIHAMEKQRLQGGVKNGSTHIG